MDQLLSIFMLIVAVTCVMVATQPARPAARRRARAAAAVTKASTVEPPAVRAGHTWGDTQRWSRRDFQQAIARDHAFPGGDNVWPRR